MCCFCDIGGGGWNKSGARWHQKCSDCYRHEKYWLTTSLGHRVSSRLTECLIKVMRYRRRGALTNWYAWHTHTHTHEAEWVKTVQQTGETSKNRWKEHRRSWNTRTKCDGCVPRAVPKTHAAIARPQKHTIHLWCPVASFLRSFISPHMVIHFLAPATSKKCKLSPDKPSPRVS